MNPIRFAVTSIVILAMNAGLLWLAALTAPRPFGPLGLLVAVVGAPLMILSLGSLYEWIVHRWLYHAPWPRIPLFNQVHVVHHKGHHWNRFPPDHYVEPGPVRRIHPEDPMGVAPTRAKANTAWWMQFAIYLTVGIPLAMIPSWLFTGNALFAISATVSGFICCYMFIEVHDRMHYPSDSWMERMGWFKFLNRHHYIHHIDESANLNFMLPFCDWAFGSMRRELTARELKRWPTFEDATRLPQDQSVPAK